MNPSELEPSLNRLSSDCSKHSPTERVILYPERQEVRVKVQTGECGYVMVNQTWVEKSDRPLNLVMNRRDKYR